MFPEHITTEYLRRVFALDEGVEVRIFTEAQEAEEFVASCHLWENSSVNSPTNSTLAYRLDRRQSGYLPDVEPPLPHARRRWDGSREHRNPNTAVPLAVAIRARGLEPGTPIAVHPHYSGNGVESVTALVVSQAMLDAGRDGPLVRLLRERDREEGVC